MPVARLITKVLEDADELAADLRGRGFSVEIVSPDQIPSHRVDLEITVEECASEQALRNAEELSKREDIHVFIAPGAIIESLRPMIVVPLFTESSEAMTDAEPVVPDEIVSAQHLASLAAAEDVVDEVMPPEVSSVPSVSELYTEAVHPFAQLEEPASEQLRAAESPAAEQPAVYALEAEEVYPPSDWPIWQPLASEPQYEQELAAAAVESVPPRRSIRAFPGKAWQNDRLFWRIAAMVSVGALSALLLGASAHRFSPIPRGVELTGEQGMPFEKVKSENALSQDAAALSPATSVVSPVPTTELKRVVAQVPVVEGPSPAEHLTKRVERPKSVQRAATRHVDNAIAEDTVVRYGKKPAPPRVEAQKKSGIRHYSDLR